MSRIYFEFFLSVIPLNLDINISVLLLNPESFNPIQSFVRPVYLVCSVGIDKALQVNMDWISAETIWFVNQKKITVNQLNVQRQWAWLLRFELFLLF